MSIEVRSVSKRFEGFAAVDDISLQVGKGEFSAFEDARPPPEPPPPARTAVRPGA